VSELKALNQEAYVEHGFTEARTRVKLNVTLTYDADRFYVTRQDSEAKSAQVRLDPDGIVYLSADKNRHGSSSAHCSLPFDEFVDALYELIENKISQKKK
jgi:hypothetical protein